MQTDHDVPRIAEISDVRLAADAARRWYRECRAEGRGRMAEDADCGTSDDMLLSTPELSVYLRRDGSEYLVAECDPDYIVEGADPAPDSTIPDREPVPPRISDMEGLSAIDAAFEWYRRQRDRGEGMELGTIPNADRVVPQGCGEGLITFRREDGSEYIVHGLANDCLVEGAGPLPGGGE